MHDLPDPHRARLDPTERMRRDNAARTLAASRITDLAALGAAGSILMIEALRSALDDTLRLLETHAE
ncbi:hypothetical protein ACIOD1_13125 [Streptomyces sp. NPDC088097]|uniref:hypothetical protein n=1 Tax=Streptomyces sp. NPDC088097 TaxID=3365823 RepID=UPI00381C6660